MDIQSAVAQRAGVGRYARLLAQNLGSTAGSNQLSLFYFDFKKRGEPFAVPRAQFRVVRWCPGRLAQWAWKTVSWPPFDSLAGPADIYHFPNFIIPPLRKGKALVTIHDMAFLRFPQYAEDNNRKYLEASIPDTVRRADAILTVSRFSAGEICELLHVEPDRVHSVYHGISAEFTRPDDASIQAVLARHRIEKPYILTVGTVEPRKNIPFLIEVFENLKSYDGQLVIAGMPGWKYGPILDRMRQSRCARRIRYVEYVPNDDLPSLYGGAELFVLTSFYEGFGFPPIEAMACGTPVISSSGGALPEVLGTGAVILEDFNLDRWITQVERLLSDSNRRQELVAAGRIQAARYSWTQAALDTWKVYSSLV